MLITVKSKSILRIGIGLFSIITFCIALTGCSANSSIHPSETSYTNGTEDADFNETSYDTSLFEDNSLAEEEAKERIVEILANSNIEGTTVSDVTGTITVLDILTYMFIGDYSLEYNQIENNPGVYDVTINGNALLNPELREYAGMDGVTAPVTMIFTVDIEDNKITLKSDPNNIYLLYFANYL